MNSGKYTQLWPHSNYENNVNSFKFWSPGFRSSYAFWLEMTHFLWCNVGGKVAIFNISLKKPLPIASQSRQWLLKAQSRGSSIPSFPWPEFIGEELLLNEPQEPCWVYFSWVYIRFDFCWSLHFSSFHLSLPVVPVGEGCVWRVPEPECCACRLFISAPSPQAVPHLCLVHTFLDMNSANCPKYLQICSFEAWSVDKPQRAVTSVHNCTFCLTPTRSEFELGRTGREWVARTSLYG